MPDEEHERQSRKEPHESERQEPEQRQHEEELQPPDVLPPQGLWYPSWLSMYDLEEDPERRYRGLQDLYEWLQGAYRESEWDNADYVHTYRYYQAEAREYCQLINQLTEEVERIVPSSGGGWELPEETAALEALKRKQLEREHAERQKRDKSLDPRGGEQADRTTPTM
jgi:hypothetical protein